MEKILEISTNLIGLDGLFCTYWGAGKSEYTLHEDSIESDFEDGSSNVHPDYYWTYFDNKKYMKDWNEAVQNFIGPKIEEALNDIGVEAEFIMQDFSSPREYNFSHDVSYFDLKSADFGPLVKYCMESENFGQFLKDHYSSYDGFMSFTSNNIEDWKEDIDADKATAWGAAIRFLLIEEGMYEEIKDGSYYAFEGMYYSEYVDYTVLDEFIESIEKGTLESFEVSEEWQKAILSRYISSSTAFKAVVDRYYTTKTFEEVVAIAAQELNLEYDFVLTAVRAIYNDIESNNLKLEL